MKFPCLVSIISAIVPCLHAQDSLPSIVINEIHYHPSVETEFVEFIELYNATAETIDLSDWSFSDGIDHVFPQGTSMGPGAFFVLAQNRAAYNRKFGSIFSGGIKADAQWDVGTLSNTGESLTLRDAANLVIDRVDYQDHFPWPTLADGGTEDDKDISMELLHPGLDNGLSGHWRSSAKPTPGKVNSVLAQNPPPAVRQVTHNPEQPSSSDVVTISAKATDADSVATVMLEVQVVRPGDYVRLRDAAYASSWQAIPMNDGGVDGDDTAMDATYTATVPAGMMEHRSLIRYRIRAEDGAGQAVTLPYEDDPTPNRAFFVYDGVPAWTGSVEPGSAPKRTFTPEELTTLPVYHLIATEADVERSQYNTGSENIRFLGTMVYDGKVYDHLEFRVRGEFSTYQSGKNKWKFFFNRGNAFEARDNYGIKYPGGFSVMNFTGCASPWVPANRGMAGLDETTAFRLQALAGVPSPKLHYLHFRVIDAPEESPSNDQYGGDLWGLYLSQETPDGRMLDRLGLPEGNTFKIEGGAADQKHQGPFESNYTNFATQSSRTQTLDWWRENMNLHHYYGFRAINRAVGNIDIREGWNHFFYQHPNGQWSPIPWDLDMTFMPETHWSGTIDAKACLNVDEIAIEYANRCRELMDLLLEDGTAGGGQVGSVVEENLQWVGSQKTWIDVSTLTKASSMVEVTTVSPHGLASGDRVSIVGVATSGYDGEREVQVLTDTSFTFRVSIFTANPGPIEGVQVGIASGGGSVWAEIDMAMWNDHPRTAGGHRKNFYANPTTQGFRGGDLRRTLTTADVSGFADYVKGFTTDTDPDGFAVGDGDQRGYGYNYVRFESEDGNAPDRPSISYIGLEDFPVDGLTFTSTRFSGGSLFQKQTFAGMQWRLGEIYNIATPNYEAGTPWRYEIDAVWESGTMESFAESITVPNNVVRPGSTYRARVRHLNQLGGWSHWSTAVEFVAGSPDLLPYQSLLVTELMYHPGAVTAAETAAGFRREDFEFIELYNAGTQALDLSPLRFTKGVDFDFDEGSILSLSPGAFVIVVANAEAFAERYGANVPVAGVYSGNLANGGERIKLSFGAGSAVSEFVYDDADGWPTESDGNGRSLIRRDLALNSDLSSADSWTTSLDDGSPGSVVAVPPMPSEVDSDSDGMPDAAEVHAGTDPNNPLDVLKVASVRRNSDLLLLTWTSVVGKTYRVEYAPGLAPTAWESIATREASSTETTFTDDNADRVKGSAGFYRVRVP